MLFYYTILVRNVLFSKSPKIKQDICTYTHEARTVLSCAHHNFRSNDVSYHVQNTTSVKMVGQTSTITQFLVKLDLRP